MRRLEIAFNKISKYCGNIDDIVREGEYLIDLLIKALRNVNYNMREVPGHELEHSFRVFEIAIVIGCKLGAALKPLAIAALLHDVGRFSNRDTSENHAEVSARIAEKILRNCQEKNLIVRMIKEHSYSSNKKPSSLEAAILQDADKIDALGFIGIARVFAYGGYMRRVIYNTIYNQEGQSSLQHFYDKILKLDNLMNTDLGRAIAKKRANKIKYFIRELIREINLEDFLSLYINFQ